VTLSVGKSQGTCTIVAPPNHRCSSMRIGASIIRGTLGYSALNNLAILFNIVVQIVLARLLSPSIFGTVALAFAILAVFQFFVHWGTNAALMQEGRDDALADTLFWLRICCCTLTGAFVVVGYFVLGPFYSTEIRQCMVILAFCTMSAFVYDVFKAVMQREMMLVTLGWIDLLCVLIGGLVAIVLVIAGYGLWGLVSFHISMALIRGLLYVLYSPYRPRFRFNQAEAKWAWHFSRKIIMVGALDNVDFKLGEWYLGTVRGETELGIYGLAWRLSHLFQRLFLPVLELTSLPTYARYKKNAALLQQAYDFVVRVLVRTITPASILSGIFAHELIIMVAGDQWGESVQVFRILIVFAIASPLFRMHQQLLYALGRPEVYLRLKYLQVGLFALSAIPLTYSWGGPGLAISMGIGFFGGIILVFIKVRDTLSVPILSVLNALLAGSIATALALWIIFNYSHASSFVLMGTVVPFFICVYSAWLFATERETTVGDLRRIYSAVFSPER
jgi:O-antigen/teichoic acid export membrane protein